MGVVDSDGDKYVTINFEETELRLGLPGGSDLKSVGSSSNSSNSNNNNNSCSGKRGFLETVDLKLELSSTKECCGKGGVGVVEENSKGNNLLSSPNDPAKPPSKAQVVGWPPIRSFRKNVMAVQKSGTAANDGDKTTATAAASTSGAAFVKVSMDGAPYLRKVDLNLYKSYRELSNALGQMFSSFTFGNCGSQGMKDFMNESKLVDILSGSEYVATYEDKDGDWMLVGDVPWELFVDSCKRLRIVKGSEAIGLAPRAVEKCKNKS